MYNAFISYSHSSDDNFAPALQNALQKFAKPWLRKRNLEIFRDESSLDASPHLWGNITKALDQSEYLILLASPISENSPWVNKEVEYWLEHKSIDKILIALTAGKMEWDNQNNCFLNPDKNSLPPTLDDKFTDEPFFIDLRQSKTEQDLSLNNPIFKKEILKLAAKLHGKAPNDLASEEVSIHRKMIRLRNGVFIVLSLLLISATILAVKAIFENNKAQSLLVSVIAKDLTNDDPTIAIRLAEYGYKKHPSNDRLSQEKYYSVEKTLEDIWSNAVEKKLLFYEKKINGNRFKYSSNKINGTPLPVQLTSAAISPDENKIAIAFNKDNSVIPGVIYDYKSDNLIELSAVDTKYNLNQGIEFSPDGEKVMIIYAKGPPIIYDAKTGIPGNVQIFKPLENDVSIYNANFSPDGTKIIVNYLTNSGKRAAGIWDVKTGELIDDLDCASCRLSPDGAKIMTFKPIGNSEYNVSIWDRESQKQISNLKEYIHFSSELFFSTDGNKVFYFSPYIKPHLSRIWDVNTGEIITNFHEGKSLDFFREAKFSPDDKIIATRSIMGDAILRKSETGDTIAVLRPSRFEKFSSISFSSDGNKIVTASLDYVKIWDLKFTEFISNYDRQLEINDTLESLAKGAPIMMVDSADRNKISRILSNQAPFKKEFDSLRALVLNTEQIIAWLNNQGQIHTLTQEDLNDLYLNFIKL
ncbi:toll/interleukin-1 receptor domain-containing protein [Algoriphagus lutimaris]|uniref:toll/interleukin-1 receptor domain-containing protein n=1 Tax=Algoriphagus lutimaris TaxID=613197 RepID=UPI00196AAB6F|nr:toll/interleukin-1 receptor domain-containing protein [Algoriphagus lutimaris]MBN3521355.1 toll/interleukin-1 receptor domain-containing protein [Algoriphagus lutimaris]